MPDTPRFLTIKDVADELQTSPTQVRALIQRRELRALQIGGRRQWRIGRDDLEAYLEEAYRVTAAALEDGLEVGDDGDPAL